MNQFLEACGGASPLQITVDAPGASAREVHSFDLPFVIVGRLPEADLRLDHPEVSERHAYFQLIDGRLVFLDLGSRLGIQQAGKRRKQGLLLREPATRIGPYRLRFLNEDTEPTHGPASSGFDADETETSDLAEGFLGKTFDVSGLDHGGDGLILGLSHRSRRHSRAEVRGGITLVGSGADCGVRLIDPSVSSHHGSLVQTPEGTWLIDLLGKGGIKVNGLPVNHARLFPGDEVQIGASALRVESIPSPLREAGRLGFARSARNPWANAPEAVAKTAAPQMQPQPPVMPEAAVAPPEMPRSNEAALLAAAELRKDAFVSAIPTPTPTPTVKAMELSLATEDAAAELAGTGLSVTQTAEIVERVVSPLIEQLAEMRQQMLDEFHQARVMMFETIGSMREEHSSAFNKELDQLRQLAEELETHRRELAQNAENLAANAEPQGRYPRTFADEMITKSILSHLGNGPAAEREPVAVSNPNPTPAHAPSPVLEPEVELVMEPEVTILPSRRSANGESNGNGHVVPHRPHDEQVHAVLCDRITRLKEDHQSRWQKILGIFPSAAAGKP